MSNATLGRTILTYVIVGPPAGAASFIAFMSLFEVARGGTAPPDFPGVLNGLPFIIAFGYILGALPAIVTSLVAATINRRTPNPWLRVLAAGVVGAIASCLCLFWVVFGPNGNVPKWVVVTNFAWTGAGAALASALVLEWMTRPKGTS